MTEITLTADQSRALGRVLAWARTDDPFLTIAGHAGTGKTTLMREVVRELGERKVALAAPTNKATAVLRRTTPGADCFTIYAGTGLRLQDDAERKYVARQNSGKVSRYPIIVVDEASMVGLKLFQACEHAHDEYGTKFLFVGDPLQLPPVGDGQHVAFRLPKVELTEVVRQAADNPILRFAQDLRRSIVDGAPVHIPKPVAGEGVHRRNGTWRDELLDAFELDHESRRAIAWRNATVSDLARNVRRRLHGAAADRFIVGERVFAAKPLETMWTDQEATVEVIDRECDHPLYPELRAVPVALRPDEGPKVIGYVVADSSSAELERRLKAIQDSARGFEKTGGRRDRRTREAWRDYHRLSDAFADVRSVHVITAHRSQGSTFDEVHVDLRDIQGCRERELMLRLVYVACTRARRNVWLRTS